MIKVVNCHLYKGDDVAYVGRPSPLGNPYTHKLGTTAIKVDSIRDAISLYKKYLYRELNNKNLKILNEIKLLILFYRNNGNKLALSCHCVDKHGNGECHAFVIKELLERILGE